MSVGARLSLGFILGLALVATLADCLASDLPLLARKDGVLYVLPNLRAPATLTPFTLEELRAGENNDDFTVAPPIPFGPHRHDKGYAPLMPPSSRHWLGTDAARRDVLARLIHGSRFALFGSAFAVGLALVLGVTIGVSAGLGHRWLDVVLSRLMDAVVSIPMFFLLIALLGLLREPSTVVSLVVIGVVAAPRIARLVRAETLRIRELPFIRATYLLELSYLRRVLWHVLPSVLPPALVAAAFSLAHVVVVEAALGFLGLSPGHAVSLGSLLEGALAHVHAYWLVLPPGIVLFLTVWSYNNLAEELRRRWA